MNSAALNNAIRPPLTIVAVLCLGATVTVFAQNNQDELKQRVLAQAQGFGADD